MLFCSPLIELREILTGEASPGPAAPQKPLPSLPVSCFALLLLHSYLLFPRLSESLVLITNLHMRPSCSQVQVMVCSLSCAALTSFFRPCSTSRLLPSLPACPLQVCKALVQSFTA